MSVNMPKYQSGLSFSGFIVGTFILVVLVLFGFKLIPAYMDDAAIQSMFVAVAHDPEMKSANLSELRNSFAKRATVNWVSRIKPQDIDIYKDDSGNPVLSASYEVRIKLVGNVTILLEFNPTSAGK